jgi:hypothetical protein
LKVGGKKSELCDRLKSHLGCEEKIDMREMLKELEDEMKLNVKGYLRDIVPNVTKSKIQEWISVLSDDIKSSAYEMYKDCERDGILHELKNRERDWVREYMQDIFEKLPQEEEDNVTSSVSARGKGGKDESVYFPLYSSLYFINDKGNRVKGIVTYTEDNKIIVNSNEKYYYLSNGKIVKGTGKVKINDVDITYVNGFITGMCSFTNCVSNITATSPPKLPDFMKDEKKTTDGIVELRRIKRDIFRRQFMSFDDFVATIDTLLYFENMVDSDRYTLADISSWNYNANLIPSVQCRTIERYSWLEMAYKMFDVKKTPEQLEALLEKYSTWFYTLLKKLYKKYIDPYYDVVSYRDGDEDSSCHIFL